MKEIAKSYTKTISVAGSGKTENLAYDSAFLELRTKLTQKNGYLIYSKPISVMQTGHDKVQRTERFLFFFWPKVKTMHHVKLDVLVEVTTINEEK